MLVGLVLDRDRVLQALLEEVDPALEQPLLVLRGVVLEVLGEVPELARMLDRLGDGPPPGPSSSTSSASSSARCAGDRYSVFDSLTGGRLAARLEEADRLAHLVDVDRERGRRLPEPWHRHHVAAGATIQPAPV